MTRVQERLRLRDLTSPPYGVGNFRPGVVLLVGEQAANPTSAPEQEPFCTDVNCSMWLNQVLDAASVKESELFWVNARFNDGSEIKLDHLVTLLRPRRVVTLGKVAERLATLQGVESTAVPHPQYWKRFHHHKRYPLLDLLLEELACDMMVVAG